MKNILLRADSSSIIGTGHVMRDLVLAKEFDGDNLIFATQDLEGNINHKIIESGYKLELLKSNEIEELSLLIKKESIELIIIDNYAIDAEYEKKLKIQNPTLKIFVLDDTYEKHDCEILLNHNIYADAKKYKNLVPKSCELRCGRKFTLIRDEFIQEKAKKPYKPKSSTLNIFIAMGGADTQNLNPKILKTLKKFKHIAVDMVTTTANSNLKELEKYAKGKKWITLHINSNNIAKLVRKSDFAVITPSVSANELYFMQKPFMAIKTADNQKYMYKFLKKNGYDVMNKFSAKKLSHSLKSRIS